jgi:hypothetical protein
MISKSSFDSAVCSVLLKIWSGSKSHPAALFFDSPLISSFIVSLFIIILYGIRVLLLAKCFRILNRSSILQFEFILNCS